MSLLTLVQGITSGEYHILENLHECIGAAGTIDLNLLCTANIMPGTAVDSNHHMPGKDMCVGVLVVDF
jgi:hypothetical protein